MDPAQVNEQVTQHWRFIDTLFSLIGGLVALLTTIVGAAVSRLFGQVDDKADKSTVDANHAQLLRELDQMQTNQQQVMESQRQQTQMLVDILTQTGTHKSL